MQTNYPLHSDHLVHRTALSLALFISPCILDAAEVQTGEQIYHQRCAKCHGKAGEGTDDHHPHPLVGDLSVGELASLIAKTMPEDEPETCVGEDAEKVAAYIYGAFYSPAAQALTKPVRVELSRLTVRQYRNTIADLIGSFRNSPEPAGQQGLKGEYFNSRKIGRSDRVLERVDPLIDFDFGESSPLPDKIDPKEFSIRWEGSVLAPDTGEYEFIVKTDHGARLWVNDREQPLIDAWVKSGNDMEYRAAIRLLGGRYYPLQLEFSKSIQGVKQTKEQRDKAPIGKAFVGLWWKLPQRAPELIPQRNLSPHEASETLVVQAPFPPDDRSVGYERGTSISKAWDQATTDAAIEVAGYIVTHLRDLAGISSAAADASQRATRAREFCARFAERAFRRPLSDEQQKFFVDQQFERSADWETAVKRVVILVLKSPRFLYCEIGNRDRDSYDVASRLSFSLWDSLPDQTLLEAAAAGQLVSREQVITQAERMLSDLRTRAKLHDFFLQWLKVDQLPEMSKDPVRFPEFDAALASDLRTSLDLFLEDVMWSEDSDFRQILLGDFLYLNGRLAHFYGADLSPEAPFQKVWLQSSARAGVMTHPYLMAGFAYTSSSSPIHRGVFIARSLLGRSPRPPPDAVVPLPPDLHAELTTRERVMLQTRPESCQSCHSMINPLGFTLENFDAVGRYRNEEQGRPVDATGAYRTRSGEIVKFSGVRELAAFLADSEETHSAFVEQLFHYLVKQPIRAFGSTELSAWQEFLAKNNFNVRRLMIEIMATTALKGTGDTP